MDDYFIKWYPTLRDVMLVGVREPTRLILERFPKDWERWLRSRLRPMDSWTSPMICERIRQFYQEHGRNVKVKHGQATSSISKVKTKSAKNPNKSKQPYQKLYYKPRKDANVNHLTEAPTGGSDKEEVYMIDRDAVVAEIKGDLL